MAETTVQQAAENEGVGGLLVRRWLGAWIDLLALGGLFFLPAIAFGLTARGEAALAEAVGSQLALIGLGLALLYFPLLEGVWGRSLGKLVTGLRVVDENGRAPGIGRALVQHAGASD